MHINVYFIHTIYGLKVSTVSTTTHQKKTFQCTVCKYTLKVLIVDIFAVFVSIARRFALKRTHFAKLTAKLSHTTILASDEQLISEVITV